MVLQAAPTEARIWGFLDGDTNSVTNDLTCNNGEKTTLVFTPDKVRNILLLYWKKIIGMFFFYRMMKYLSSSFLWMKIIFAVLISLKEKRLLF